MALRDLRDDVGDVVVLIADLCLDEYTDHGHCGLLTPDGEVDNDATLERYAEVALAQAEAGADIVAPSGMMDGQVRAIRDALDGDGPRRGGDPRLRGQVRVRALRAVPRGGRRRDRRRRRPQGYQQDPANAREALEEIRADVAEGADMVMVKPALAYLDVIARARAGVDVPAGRLPRVRRVRDDQGGRRAGLDRRRRRSPSSTSPPSSGPAPT